MKVIQHGRYWREDLQRAVKDGIVQCPECGRKMEVMRDYVPPFALCVCGCGFMYEEKDFLEEGVK